MESTVKNFTEALRFYKQRSQYVTIESNTHVILIVYIFKVTICDLEFAATRFSVQFLMENCLMHLICFLKKHILV